MVDNYAQGRKNVTISARALIGLFVLNIAYSLVRFVLFNTVYQGSIPSNFIPIESIITNTLYASFLAILLVGIAMLGVYYQKETIIGTINIGFLSASIICKLLVIVFRIVQLATKQGSSFMKNGFHTLEIIAAVFLITFFVTNDFFFRQLKSQANIGLGWSPIPYIYGLFTLIYPINDLLNIFGISFGTTNPRIFGLFQVLSYIAAVVEIILYFDIMRRFDNCQKIGEIADSKRSIQEDIKGESKESVQLASKS